MDREAKFSAVLKAQSLMEDAGKDFLKSAVDLAHELVQKDFNSLTEVEREFVKSFGKFALFGFLTEKISG